MTAAELRALLAVATKGPWEATQDNGYFKVCRDSGDGETHECVLSTFSLREEDSQAADAALIIFLRNNAERFAELLAAEEAKAESRREWTSCRPCDGWDYRVDGVYAGQVWPSSSGEWWWCLRDNLDNGIEPTQLLARAAVENAVRAGR